MKSIKRELDKGGIKEIRKNVFIGLLILIGISLIFFIFLRLFMPCDCVKEGFPVTITGVVKTNLEDTSSYSNHVYAYFPYPNLRQLTKAETIEYTEINWGGKEGKFSITFRLPIEMDVILTAKATGCNHTILHVSPEQNIQQVTLHLEEGECYDRLNLPDTKDKVKDVAIRILDTADEQHSDSSFDKTEISLIKEDIDEGRRMVTRVNDEPSENESLLTAYVAYWLGWRAHYKIKLYTLKNCVDESLSFTSKNDSCVILPYQQKIILMDANRLYKDFSRSGVLSDKMIYNAESLEDAKTYVQNIHGRLNHLSDVVEDCENALEVIKNSYENQKDICDLRKVSLFIFKFTEALTLVCIGFLLAFIVRAWYEKK